MGCGSSVNGAVVTPRKQELAPQRKEKERCKLFGEPLQVVSNREGRIMPIFVEEAIARIQRGKHVEGIFRLSGSFEETAKAKVMLDNDEVPAGQMREYLGTLELHTVSNLLKLYLRELPEPLISTEQWIKIAQLTEAQRAPDVVPYKLYEILKDISVHKKAVLEKLGNLLEEINELAMENLMSRKVLCILLGPCIMHETQTKNIVASLNELQSLSGVLELILENWKELLHVFATEEKTSSSSSSNST